MLFRSMLCWALFQDKSSKGDPVKQLPQSHFIIDAEFQTTVGVESEKHQTSDICVIRLIPQQN